MPSLTGKIVNYNDLFSKSPEKKVILKLENNEKISSSPFNQKELKSKKMQAKAKVKPIISNLISRYIENNEYEEYKYQPIH